jgi:HSP20 family molecular chaperone IbpA
MATQTPTKTQTQTPTKPQTHASRPREQVERATRKVEPRVDIYETDKAYVLVSDMPGVAPDGVEVVAERDTLVIRGRAETPATAPDYQEFELADYQRAFMLTEDLDTAGITATLRDGVLRLEIPKSPRVQPKKIPVRTE